MYTNSRLLLAAAVFFMILGAALPVLPVRADLEDMVVETGCGLPDMPYYTGVVNPERATYDVYVKLGKVGQTAEVSGYVRFDDGSTNCITIGTTSASGNEWRKLGSYTDIDGDSQTVLQLSSDVLEDIPNANRPTLMLVSQTSPVCVPAVQCEVTYKGEKMYITPTGQPTEEYALNIVQAKSLEDDSVQKVEYYADNELLYETKQLEPFNTNLSPNYAGTLYRVVHFTSGQKAISEQTAPGPHMDSFATFTTRTYKKYQQLVLILAVTGGLLLIIYGIRFTLSALGRRHMWRVAHGLAVEKPEKMLSAQRVASHARRDKAIKIVERVSLIVGVSMIIALTLSMSIVQIGTVSGHSMDTSFSDGQKIVINKFPVTLANLNGTAYVPKRGEVVVAYPNFGTNLSDDAVKDGETIIKRVVGLPGERVVVAAGVLTVYNGEHPDGFNPAANTEWSDNVQPDDSTDQIDITLEKNEIFLCGDNRPVSIDSRFNGPIATSQIVGVVH